jgi:hypothetical protein
MSDDDKGTGPVGLDLTGGSKLKDGAVGGGSRLMRWGRVIGMKG